MNLIFHRIGRRSIESSGYRRNADIREDPLLPHAKRRRSGKKNLRVSVNAVMQIEVGDSLRVGGCRVENGSREGGNIIRTLLFADLLTLLAVLLIIPRIVGKIGLSSPPRESNFQ